MDVHYPTLDVPATPEYVLAVLRDNHRQQCEYDWEADRNAKLSFDSTIAEWREACDLVEWKGLGRAMNQEWEIECSDFEWATVLEPDERLPLLGVCELIAHRAPRRRIRSARFFGGDCHSAGAFLTVRSILANAGADAEHIKPSTPLAPYTRRYGILFLGPISRLAPGALPLVHVWHPVYDASMWSIVASFLVVLLGWCCNSHWLAILGFLACLLSYGLVWASSRWLLPLRITFGELKTFRDMACALAAGVNGGRSEERER